MTGFSLYNAVLTHLLQVSTLMQWAVGVLQPHPYIADHFRGNEVLAAACQEPSAAVLMQLGSLDDHEHDAKW